jgi:hypothetical protein
MNSTQIRLHDVRRSPGFARRIRTRCEARDRLHPRATACAIALRQFLAAGLP